MGLVDKLKNIFTEEVEEDEEIKVEQIKREVKSVPIESPSVEKREKTRDNRNLLEEVEEDIAEEKTKTPVFFTDRDFEDLIKPKKRSEKHGNEEKKVEEKKKEEVVSKPYGGNYVSHTIIKKEKEIFKPTPIISPVYGVLDKNYHKEDIVDKKDRIDYESVDGLSVDSIRNKAYGTLEDDLEDTILSHTLPQKRQDITYTDTDELDLFDELEDDENLENTAELVIDIKKQEKNIKELEEITMDLTKELDNLLMEKEKFNKEKEDLIEDEDILDEEEKMSESDLFNLIDSMYEEGTDEE